MLTQLTSLHIVKLLGRKIDYMRELSLNSQWRMSFCDIGQWTVEEAARGEEVACRVPGAVHLALIEAGIIEEPFKKLNMQACRFAEDKDFWHFTDFIIEEGFIQDQSILYFEGVDVNADYYLNGEHLGSSCNAFCQVEFDITNQLNIGKNTIAVRVNEGIKAVKDENKSIEYMKHSWNQQEPYRTYVRKPQFCYGWDWAQRLTTCGIYKPVYIKSYEKAYLKDVYITSGMAAGAAEIKINCGIECLKAGDYKIKYTVYTDERFEEPEIAASGESAYSEAVQFTIESPRLWWCSGAGDPYLYRVVVELTDGRGKVLHRNEQRHGVRTIRIEQRPIGKKGQKNKTFTVVLNGKRIYAKGANWVPVDQIIGRITKERYEKLIDCAVDMNMNMFRVWGGGFYEGSAFFDACDRRGLMVWHDFMFACGYYPDFDHEFMENVRKEAVYQVLDKRKRTCFIGWSGNNENYSMYEGHQKYIEEPFPFYGRKIYEEILAPVCAELDPSREFRLSSPYGGDCADDIKEGDQHFWGVYHEFHEHYDDFFRIADSKASFVSEFGIIAPMNLESLKKCCDEEQCRQGSEQWRFHSNTGENFDRVVGHYFGKDAKSVPVDQYILMAQSIQAEAIRYAFEKYRSEKFLCSGTLFWMFSDCYPTSGWCFVDYYYNKKPLYYYTKRAFAPVGLFFKGYNPNTNKGMEEYQEYYRTNGVSFDIAAVNDSFSSMELEFTVNVMRLDGTMLAQVSFSHDVPENAAQSVLTLDLNKYIPDIDVHSTVVICRAEHKGETVAVNRRFLAPYKDLALKKADIRCKMERAGDHIQLTLSADSYVWLCHLPHGEGVSFDNNDFDIVPGEEVKVNVYGTDSYEFKCLSMNDCIL